MLASVVVGGTVAAARADLCDVGQSACASQAAARSRYSAKVRYYNKHKLVQYWARIKDAADSNADVPITVKLATDKAGQQVIASKSGIGHAAQSHIVRGSFLLGKGSIQRGSTFYCHVFAGADGSRIRRFQLKAH